jgi:hypothetical protein
MGQGHVILFEHINFHGAHKHIFQDEPNLNAPDDSFFNDITSSIVILEGNWDFFIDSNFQNRTGNPGLAGFGPGLISWVENAGIQNDAISSLKARAQ